MQITTNFRPAKTNNYKQVPAEVVAAYNKWRYSPCGTGNARARNYHFYSEICWKHGMNPINTINKMP